MAELALGLSSGVLLQRLAQAGARACGQPEQGGTSEDAGEKSDAAVPDLEAAVSKKPRTLEELYAIPWEQRTYFERMMTSPLLSGRNADGTVPGATPRCRMQCGRAAEVQGEDVCKACFLSNAMQEPCGLGCGRPWVVSGPKLCFECHAERLDYGPVKRHQLKYPCVNSDCNRHAPRPGRFCQCCAQGGGTRKKCTVCDANWAVVRGMCRKCDRRDKAAAQAAAPSAA